MITSQWGQSFIGGFNVFNASEQLVAADSQIKALEEALHSEEESKEALLRQLEDTHVSDSAALRGLHICKGQIGRCLSAQGRRPRAGDRPGGMRSMIFIGSQSAKACDELMLHLRRVQS
eukprot:Skav229346  [mRNA]  locus=scaffold2596:388978:395806:- [translate_table: standard]